MLPTVQGQRVCVCGMGMRGDGVEERGGNAERKYLLREEGRRCRGRMNNRGGKSTREAQQTAEPEQWML